jgi:hypothetical protein
MKKKLKFISYFIIAASTLILSSQIYHYNSHIDSLNQLNVNEFNKEIIVSLLMLCIGSILLYRSIRIKE